LRTLSLFGFLAIVLGVITAEEPGKPAAPKKELAIDLGGVKLELVRIEPGEFLMGSPESDKDAIAAGLEKPRRKVTISKPFYMGRFEVRRGEFRAFVAATGYKTDAERGGPSSGLNAQKRILEHGPQFNWKNTGFEQTDDHPVVNVSWDDAKAFCAWLQKHPSTKAAGLRVARLPTEAEWEYACRAGTTTRFYSGDAPESLKGVANVGDESLKAKYKDAFDTVEWDDGYAFTAPVGKFKPNAFGLYDMHGNVAEWCEDFFGPYDDLAAIDPWRRDKHPAHREKDHVFRSSSFRYSGSLCRAAQLYFAMGPCAGDDIGFRVVLRAE
jgi:formylglycine-generating enzyme required for sulfatase activity